MKKPPTWKPRKIEVMAKLDKIKSFKCAVHAKQYGYLAVHAELDRPVLEARKTKAYDSHALYYAVTHVKTGYRIMSAFIDERSAKAMVEVLEERCADSLAFTTPRQFTTRKQRILILSVAKAVCEDGLLEVKSVVKAQLQRILDASR